MAEKQSEKPYIGRSQAEYLRRQALQAAKDAVVEAAKAYMTGIDAVIIGTPQATLHDAVAKLVTLESER